MILKLDLLFLSEIFHRMYVMHLLFSGFLNFLHVQNRNSNTNLKPSNILAKQINNGIKQ